MQVSLEARWLRWARKQQACGARASIWHLRTSSSLGKHALASRLANTVARGSEDVQRPLRMPPLAGEGAAAPSATSLASSSVNAEVLKLVALLPPDVRQQLEAHPRLHELLEVVLDLGRPPLARFPGGDERLAEAAVRREDLAHAVAQVGEFGADNRAGIDRTLHRISALRNRRGGIVGLTCRVGRAIPGSAAMLADLAASGYSILLLGRPGVGKTTAIRELARLLAREEGGRRRVVVVDTSNEVGGDGDVPHPGLGDARRMQVAVPEEQHHVMIEAVENHMPEVIIIDEMGTQEEAMAARTIAQRGVQLIATAHGNQLENVMKNPSLMDLVGGICSVTLGDEEARRRGVQKSILEREHPPTFDVCVEMASRDQWRLHLDVAEAVDAVLAGRQPTVEVRERDEADKIWRWSDSGGTDLEDGSGSEEEESAPSSRSGRRPEEQQQSGGAGFPPDALRAARLGAALQAAGEVPAMAARLAQAAASSSSTDSSSSSSSGPTASSSSGGSSSGPLRVFPLGLDPAELLTAAAALGFGKHLALASKVQEADAVLALRSRLKASGWVRGAAKAAGVPVFTIRSGEQPELARAVGVLLGAEGSARLRKGKGSSSSGAGGGGGDSRLEAGNLSGGSFLGGTSSSGASHAGPSSSAADEADALEEARLAIEGLVLASCQPVELLPRPTALVQLQAQLAQQRYRLPVEVVASAAGGSSRLRVLPPDWLAAAVAPAVAGAAVAAVEGGRAKEYW